MEMSEWQEREFARILVDNAEYIVEGIKQKHLFISPLFKPIFSVLTTEERMSLLASSMEEIKEIRSVNLWYLLKIMYQPKISNICFL